LKVKLRHQFFEAGEGQGALMANGSILFWVSLIVAGKIVAIEDEVRSVESQIELGGGTIHLVRRQPDILTIF
jgi:hypothetical protein